MVNRIILITLLFWAVSACGCSGSPGAGAAEGQSRAGMAALVYVDEVVQADVTPSTVVVGTVVAKRTSVVASGAEGKVNRLHVREGAFVQAGDELSTLNMVTTDLGIEEAAQVLEERQQMYLELQNGSRPEEVSQALARLEAARVAMDAANRKFERTERLVVGNAANQDELDDARERADSTRKLYEAAQAEYDLVNAGPREESIAQARSRWEAQQKQLDYLQAEKDKRITRAPFDGIVVEEHTEDGQWLSRGDPVVTVARLDEVYVIANVDQREISNVQPGAEVDVTVDAPGKTAWKGRVDSIVPRSEWQSGSRTFPVKVTVTNETVDVGQRARPLLTEGMYARVRFEGKPRRAILVPKNALIRTEAGSRVVAVIPGETSKAGKARLVPITEGSPYGENIEVLSGDLRPGTQIVVEGAERLTPFGDLLIGSPEQSGAPVGHEASGPQEPAG